MIQRENFWVKHYAGKVKYTVEGWVERNMDPVPESFGETLAASAHKVRPDNKHLSLRTPLAMWRGLQNHSWNEQESNLTPKYVKSSLLMRFDLGHLVL